MKVEAAIAVEAGRPLEIDEVELDGPKEGECLIRLAATGVCHTDAFTLSGDDPEGLFPAVLGHEGAGVESSCLDFFSSRGKSLCLARAGAAPAVLAAVLARSGGFAAAQRRPEPCSPPSRRCSRVWRSRAGPAGLLRAPAPGGRGARR